MEDLMLFLLALLISVFYTKLESPQPEPQIKLITEDRQDSYESARNKTVEIIKERLVQIYDSDKDDKREKIVSLLLQLERLEDPDDFFDKNDHIRSYIFNTT